MRSAGGGACFASTLVLMDCPGGLVGGLLVAKHDLASTLVLMDCPGGRRARIGVFNPLRLQPLF